CADALSTEKHVSSVYDTSVFEFAQPELRNALNHIQGEEQGHGKQIYDYMSSHGLYNA
ncbi:MAG: spore coat protein, partial [Pygmaiobacter massiliensis]|nr:spore coat protein [Pygmaiobacter massiliensis]